ncbi:hypothetical protein A3B57_03955 [Microgenomates group bacterium RIFCSPLOWO2_01_FULL_47_10]|nr:MAG: hypothetical protein A3B57_03955 [Microgenomates group bacterium RIFCSPLOWO2_01_FULL_47_10]
MLKKQSAPFLGFLQATGLVIYIILIDLFFNFVVPNLDNNSAQFFTPIIMLLLFSISAVICSLLVLSRSGILFWEKKYSQAFTLLGWTVGWSLLYLLLFILIFLNT